jgi:hypothetical protein
MYFYSPRWGYSAGAPTAISARGQPDAGDRRDPRLGRPQCAATETQPSSLEYTDGERALRDNAYPLIEPPFDQQCDPVRSDANG